METIRLLVEALGVEPGALWRRLAGQGKNRWADAAGAAGTASRQEIHEILRGDWDEMTDPALERTARP
jgi:transposase-like protein